VGLTLPSELTEPLGWIGLTWPEADEELLFEAGQQWISFGQELAQVSLPADTAAGQVWATGQGEAVDAFQEWWTNQDGPQPRLAEDAAAAMLIGSALMVFAAITLALKIAFIIQLILLAIQVAQAIATAFATFGATTAEVPGFIAATRLICRKLIQQVINHITTVIKDILLKAKNLLKKVTTRRGSHLATDTTSHTPGIPGPMTVKRFEGKPMLKRFRYEDVAGHPKNDFGRPAVRRLSEVEREDYRLYFDTDGHLRHATNGSLFDTSDAVTEHTRAGGRGIFVMDEQGNLYASKSQSLGQFHHSTLGNGQPVAAAGEISVANGRVQEVTAASGHYQPGRDQMGTLQREMARHGVTNVPIFDFRGRTRWF
jgi:hypothetical protein